MPGIQESLRRSVPLPWLFEAAAAIANEDVAEMYTDAGVVSRSLRNAVNLFDLPAVSTSFDTTLEAEAVGCRLDGTPEDATVVGYVDSADDAFDVDVAGVVESGRVPTFVDACERLASVQSDATVLGGVTGPSELTAALLDGDPADHDADTVEETLFTAADVCLELANAYLDAGADGVLLLEPNGVAAFDGYVDVATPIVNVLEHYDAVGVVATETATEEDVRRIGDLGFDCLTGAVDDPTAATRAADDRDLALGVGVPAATLAAGTDAVDEFLAGLPDDALVSTAWTVPPTVDPDVLHHLMGSLD